MSKRGLGKGLGALIPEVGSVDREEVQEIAVKEIRPNPRQPRKEFDAEKLSELAASIREHGVVQPVLVRRTADGYELVAGERRWRAAQEAGVEKIPAVVRNLSGAQVLEIALIENLQREDLNPIEEADAYRRLMEEFGLSQETLAQRLGKSRPQISNTLRLLQLPDTVRVQVSAGRLSMGHAKVLLGLDDAAEIARVAERVVEEGLSVREVERVLEEAPARRRRTGGRKAPQERDAEVAAVEVQLRERLGTPVRIVPGGVKGRIEIAFYGNEDLVRLCDLLLGVAAEEEDRPTRPAGPFRV